MYLEYEKDQILSIDGLYYICDTNRNYLYFNISDIKNGENSLGEKCLSYNCIIMENQNDFIGTSPLRCNFFCDFSAPHFLNKEGELIFEKFENLGPVFTFNTRTVKIHE
jgi:hypothetical protein